MSAGQLVKKSEPRIAQMCILYFQKDKSHKILLFSWNRTRRNSHAYLNQLAFYPPYNVSQPNNAGTTASD